MFTETRNHRDSDNVTARSYLPYINDIVKKAILLDTFGVDQNKLKSHNSLLMHSMYVAADIGKDPEVLKRYVCWESEDIVTKNKKRHPVLGEFGYITGDTRKVVVVNIQEVLKVSIYDPRHSSFDNEHGWLDKYGWESRKTYVLTKENIIYEAYLKNC